MDHSEIIDALGGTSAAAEMFGITTGAISQWRTNGIPKSRLMFLRLSRPDLFVGGEMELRPEQTNQQKAA